MPEQKTEHILKAAILLERRGKAFYKRVADQAQLPEVKEFFQIMADEEDKHIEILSDQFKSLRKDNRLTSGDYDNTALEKDTAGILSKELMEKISAADFEAAAVSAAMAMEQKAIRLYSERADSTDDSEEKALYSWLADWEKSHLATLAEIDRSITENIWNDNSFWPS
ncbi:MAG: ferritin family protein [Deltaproteobacteria bacterium]|nr:ferritin family protein [Deltaproteobacteria bacterium]